MNTSRPNFKLLIACVIAASCALVTSSGWAANGKPKGKPDQPPGLTKTNGKAVGLVNRTNGTTISYAELEPEIQDPSTEEQSATTEGTVGGEGDGEDSTTDSNPGDTTTSTGPGNSGKAKNKSAMVSSAPPGNAKGKSNNSGQGNASDGLMARIVTNKDIIYTGEPLEIGVHFSQGAGLINAGLADAFLVIFSPPVPTEEGEEQAVPVLPFVVPLNQEVEEDEVPEAEEETGGTSTGQTALLADGSSEEEEEDVGAKPKKLFEVPAVDTSAIPGGTYQLGLILTVPGGDPLILDDWFNGLLGLVHIRGLTIAEEALPADADGDGMMDCTPDIEGMTCLEEEEEVVVEQPL